MNTAIKAIKHRRECEKRRKREEKQAKQALKRSEGRKADSDGG